MSLRALGRLGASLAVLGIARFGSTLSVFGSMDIGQGKSVKWGAEDWTLSFDSANSKFEFTEGVNPRSMTITSSGGMLHGTWSAESIVSASDRRLKNDIQPLSRALRVSVADTHVSNHHRPTYDHPSRSQRTIKSGGIASWVLRELQPRRWINRPASDEKGGPEARPRYGFVVDEMERILPDVIRSTADGQKQISYQDIIALVAQAAKERKQQLDIHLAQEIEETKQLSSQQAMIEELEQELNTIRGRFWRLRQKFTAPPSRPASLMLR